MKKYIYRTCFIDDNMRQFINGMEPLLLRKELDVFEKRKRDYSLLLDNGFRLSQVVPKNSGELFIFELETDNPVEVEDMLKREVENEELRNQISLLKEQVASHKEENKKLREQKDSERLTLQLKNTKLTEDHKAKTDEMSNRFYAEKQNMLEIYEAELKKKESEHIASMLKIQNTLNETMVERDQHKNRAKDLDEAIFICESQNRQLIQEREIAFQAYEKLRDGKKWKLFKRSGK